MNILFLTMTYFGDGTGRGIYIDLMRKFCDEGHDVYVVFPQERRRHLSTGIVESGKMHILGVRTLNVQKTNPIEKGLGQVLIEPLFLRGLKKNFGHVKFDIITYSTPPITLVGVIKSVKRHNPEAMTYLQLKDIFPQNAVDIGMLATNGPYGLLYRLFRRKERQLYKVSDWIGCMSPANVAYVLANNPEVSPEKVEICPNSLAADLAADNISQDEGKDRILLQRYGIPTDRPIFFYGGNLGKPQGIPFLIECMEMIKDRTDCHFLIVGDGSEYQKLKDWCDTTEPSSVTLMKSLPQSDYTQLVRSCDVGLIFLDYRFTIPNYPSRLLSCLTQRKPVIACTDPHSDVGMMAENNGYGYWCPSNSVQTFIRTVEKMLVSDIKAMGERGYSFFLENYTVSKSYEAIISHIGRK